MTVSEIKTILTSISSVDFVLENGDSVPSHFHVTEVGAVSKHFIDCGGTVRTEEKTNFQLWSAADVDHRLKPQKLLNIIRLSEQKLGIRDTEIEVEYQSDTIGKYGLDFNGREFVLTALHTACLANDKCGITEPDHSPKEKAACCTPGGACC